MRRAIRLWEAIDKGEVQDEIDNNHRWMDQHLGGTALSPPNAGNGQPSSTTAPGGDHHPTIRRPWIITGTREGRRTRICQQCGSDSPIDDAPWVTCLCGLHRCLQCAGARCSGCARSLSECMAQSQTEAAPQVEPGLPRTVGPPAFFTTGDEATSDDWRRQDLPRFEDVQGEDVFLARGGLAETSPPAARSGGPRCVTCDTDLTACGGSWRICRCRAAVCIACENEPCGRCGAPTVWGTQATKAASSSHSGPMVIDSFRADDATEEMEETLTTTAPTMTPAQAHAERLAIMARVHADHMQARQASHTARKGQATAAWRPDREKRRRGTLEVISCNPSAVTSLVSELRSSDAMGRPNVMMVQEIASERKPREKAFKELQQLGWDLAVEDPYWKQGGVGGGVAILSRRDPSARPLGGPPSSARGRLVFTMMDLGYEVLSGSVYGISGGGVAAQMQLWRDMVERILQCGRPIHFGGAIGR